MISWPNFLTIKMFAHPEKVLVFFIRCSSYKMHFKLPIVLLLAFSCMMVSDFARFSYIVFLLTFLSLQHGFDMKCGHIDIMTGNFSDCVINGDIAVDTAHILLRSNITNSAFGINSNVTVNNKRYN